ncbi:sugar phosphate nucleotidyltransferase [Candidatus Symbiobacter mobilis]|nr:NDP-sugar synthase [Candidatus Symbiobacter mobilis]
MILAAGQGTRVRPLTLHYPKPMIPILGKPVMEYLVEHLARHGIAEIMVNVAHDHGKIEQYFGDGRRWGVQLGYSYEGTLGHGVVVPKPMGSAGGMRRIQDLGGFFDDTTVVLCGDALIDLDIRAAVQEHRAKGAVATVVTLEVPESEVSRFGIVVADEDGRVRSFQEKPSPRDALSRQASTGVYLFEPQVLDLVPQGQVYDIGSQLFPQLVSQNLPFYAQCRPFQWHDIGQVRDLWVVVQRALRGEIPQARMPGIEVRPGVWVGLNTAIDWDHVTIEGPVYCGSGVRIEAGAVVRGPCWIGHGSHLCAGAHVERCVLFEYTRISPGMHFADMTVAPSYGIDRAGRVLYRGDEQTPLRWEDARA